MPEIQITIPGKPIAKKRPKFFRRGKNVGTYNCQETEEGRFMAQLSAARPEGFELIKGPIDLTLRFWMPIPASASAKKRKAMENSEIRHINKPDLDNLVKFVKDCANGILWHDDSQVDGMWVTKDYAREPETSITISWDDEISKI